MKNRLSTAVLALFLAVVPAMAGDNDEVAQWRNIGLEKSLGQRWDLGLELEYRAQDKSRFSTGLEASFKVNKYLKFGAGYSFILNPMEKPERITDKNDLPDFPGRAPEFCPDEFTQGYNRFMPYHQPPRHRFVVEGTGSVKLWKWLRISLRERYQLTYRKAHSTEKLSHREKYAKTYDFDFDEDWNVIDIWDVNLEETTDEWSTKEYKANTDQVLRSRLKLEVDKKKWKVSPFISAEAHNSVTAGDRMLLQKIRTAAGATYKFRKRNEISLSYILTFDMYDFDDEEKVRLHDRLHAIDIGYKYSF